MKVMLLPDLECYPSTYNRQGPDGVPTRLAEWRRCAEAILEVATHCEVDLVVAPGDFFRTPRPSPAEVLEVAILFRDLRASLFRGLRGNGIQVIGCAGNHDVPGAGQVGPCALVAAMGDEAWGAAAPRVLYFHEPEAAFGANVAVLPYTKAGLLGDAETSDPAALAMAVSDRLVAITRSLRTQCTGTVPAILVGHWTISGAVTSSDQVLLGSEPTIPLAELQAQGWDACLFGHIHRPQVLSERPFVAYAGGLLRRDFGEEDDARGCWIWDSETGDHEWISLPARRFLTINLDATDLEWIAGGGSVHAPLADAPIDDAVVRVVYRATEEEARGIDHGQIVRSLEQAGAHLVAGIYPDIVRSERTREASVTETTSPQEALRTYLARRSDLTDETRARVADVAARMLEEVA